jgi:hypothetical protein
VVLVLVLVELGVTVTVTVDSVPQPWGRSSLAATMLCGC